MMLHTYIPISLRGLVEEPKLEEFGTTEDGVSLRLFKLSIKKEFSNLLDLKCLVETLNYRLGCAFNGDTPGEIRLSADANDGSLQISFTSPKAPIRDIHRVSPADIMKARNDKDFLNDVMYYVHDFISDQHDDIMKKNPRVAPFFHAVHEMQKSLDSERLDSLAYKKKREGFVEAYLSTMTKLSELYFNNPGDKLLTVQDEFKTLLTTLHKQSKEMLVSKRGAVIGGLMVAFGALMVAAGVAVGLTLGWTGVGLFAGAGLIAGGAAAVAGGVVAIKEREHFSKVSRLMNNHYNLFNRLYNDEVDKPAQPKRKPQ